MKKCKVLKLVLSLLLVGMLIFGCAPGAAPQQDVDEAVDVADDVVDDADDVAGNDADVQDDDGEITLIVYTQFPAMTDTGAVFYREEADRFEEANPGIRVEFRYVGAQDFDTFFKTAVAGNEQIDVVQVNVQFLMDYVANEFLLDITDLIDIDNIHLIDEAWEQSDFLTRSDRIWGIPITMATCGFYYNREIFEEHGLEIPQTWDDIYTIGEILAPYGIYPMVYAGAEPWWNPMHFNMIFYQFTNNDGLAVNDRFMSGDFSDEVILPYIQTIEFLANLKADGIFMPGTQGMDFVAATSSFINGEAAMYFMGSWFIDGLYQMAPDFDYGIFPVPIMAGSGNVSQTPGSVGDFISVFSGSEHVEAALAYVEFMASVEVAQRHSAQVSNFVNITIGAEGFNPFPAMAYLEEIAPSTVIWLDAIWEPEIISDFQMGIQSAILGQQTAEEVMEEIIANYQRLREQGRTFIP